MTTPAPDEAPPPTDAVDAIVAQWQRVRPDLDLDTMAIFGRIHRTSKLAGRQLKDVFAPYGLALSDFDVVATLRRSGEPFELSPKQLSATLMLTSGGLTGRLDKLERAGLLRRLPDPNDRRGLRIQLTDEGKRVVDASVTDEIVALARVLGSALSAEERQDLGRLLTKLHAAYADAPLE